MDALTRNVLLRGDCGVDVQLNGKWSVRILEDNCPLGETLYGKEFNTEDEAVDFMWAMYREAEAQV